MEVHPKKPSNSNMPKTLTPACWVVDYPPERHTTITKPKFLELAMDP